VAVEDALRDLGFVVDRRTRDASYHAARPTPYLTYWVHLYGDGSALFTWEFAIAEYAGTLGLQVGSGEELNTFLYPREDVRGPQDPAWVVAQIDATEAVLRSFSLLDPAS
jgi:hypothetical protein